LIDRFVILPERGIAVKTVRLSTYVQSLRARRARRPIALAVTGLGVIFIPVLPAQAADYSWVNASGGLFSTATNWIPEGVPGAADRVIFNLGTAGYKLDSGGAVYNDQLVVGNDVVHFLIGGAEGPYVATSALDSVIVGDAAGHNGVLKLGVSPTGGTDDGGTIQSKDFVIGNQAGATGTVFIEATGFQGHQAVLTTSGVLTVGRSGTGMLTARSRSFVSANELAVGALPGSSGSVSIGGGAFTTMTIDGNVYVGGSAAGPGGVGNFLLRGGGTVVAADFKGAFTVYENGAAGVHSFLPGGQVNDTKFNDINIVGGAMAISSPGAQISGDVSVSNGGTLQLYGNGSGASGSLKVEGGIVQAVSDGLVFSGGGQIGATASSATPAPSRLTSSATFGGAVYIGGGASGPGGSGEVRGNLAAPSVHIWPGGKTWMGQNITAPGGVINDGTIGEESITAGVSAVTVTGDYTQGATGAVYARLDGSQSGSSDKLIVTGSANLDGDLHLSLLNAAPQRSDRYVYTVVSAPAITGTFDTPGPGYFLVDGHPFKIAYAAAAVTLISGLPGDVDLNEAVDTEDLGILAANWQQNLADWSTADFNGDHIVNVADLGALATNWQSGVAGSMPLDDALASFGLSGSVVPEPALTGSAMLLLPLVFDARRRRLVT
jgi:T5SS/PEP-CTERM-associated repeat protein